MRFTYHLSAITLSFALAFPAEAFELSYQSGGLDLQAHAGATFQGAVFQIPGVNNGLGTRKNYNAYGTLNGEWTSPTGWLIGAHVEADSDQGRADSLKNDKIYGYVASDYGRFEVGRQNGPARRLAYYAPIIGSGQIRGDFSRYAGSPALLWAFDSRQSFKLVYLSPPVDGFRIGASWAPLHVRFDRRQRNTFELAAQYERPVSGWVLGFSGSYVHGTAEDPLYADINSWSAGAEAKHGKLIVSGAYVWRGDSNFINRGTSQREINAGVAWRAETWSVGLSAANTHATNFDNTLAGLGASWDVWRYITLRADAIYVREKFPPVHGDKGAVLLSEIEFHL